MGEPRKDPWAEAKWVSDRPTKRAGLGTRIMAFFVMIPVGAVLANVVVLLLFAKLWKVYPILFFPSGSLLNALPVSLVGAILGAASVIYLWPSDDDPDEKEKDRPSGIE